jgi:hypothetical protein
MPAAELISLCNDFENLQCPSTASVLLPTVAAVGIVPRHQVGPPWLEPGCRSPPLIGA